MDINQTAYSSEETVHKYTKDAGLQKAEVCIFEKYKTKISSAKLLDMGIGGGRTTAHLASTVKEYVGMDFSRPFVEHCKARFGALPNVTIQYGDARDLHMLNDQEFDFILFSFNGIDYVNFDDRKRILSEFSRVLKTDGILCFSFHNKGNLDMLYSFQFPRNPLKYLWEWQRRNKVKSVNGSKEVYKSKDWFIIKDGGEDFMADTLYIDALYQQRCLEDLGFTTLNFYDALTGEQMDAAKAQVSETPWIYITVQK
jgi:ubiquinone/menaquinone biosynthesis C-methylase UbiE